MAIYFNSASLVVWMVFNLPVMKFKQLPLNLCSNENSIFLKIRIFLFSYLSHKMFQLCPDSQDNSLSNSFIRGQEMSVQAERDRGQ